MSTYRTPANPFREALRVLTNKEPPLFVQGYGTRRLSEDQKESLQDWCGEHAKVEWMTALSLIEAAELMVEQAIDNGNIEPPQYEYSLSRDGWLTYSPQGIRDAGLADKLPGDSWDFLESLEDETASHVVACRVDGVLVGWQRCTLRRGHLFAQGTWVDRQHRRNGIARSLWEMALQQLQPRSVTAHGVSVGGRKLLRRLKALNPSIEFE